MREYDATLKKVLTHFSRAAAARLTGFEVVRWLNVEIPEVRAPRVDLLGETPDGTLLHIELQSTNDSTMALRMLEYAVAVYRRYGRRPAQMVLYTGEDPLRMSGKLAEFSFECRVVDIREFDPAPLLASETLADNVITILMQHPDRRGAVVDLLHRVGAAKPDERVEALAEILILAGLRRMAPLVQREIEKMPILDDIMDHEVLGPKLRAAMAQGRQEGERDMLARLIERRFGPIPEWALKRLDSMSTGDLEDAALRVLDANSLEELLGR